MGYAPNVRFCECYIDGKYNGLYVMMETIEKSENRVNIESYDKNSRVADSYTLFAKEVMENGKERNKNASTKDLSR